jgi:hypothetical protein
VIAIGTRVIVCIWHLDGSGMPNGGWVREANTRIGMVHEGVGDAGWMLRQLVWFWFVCRIAVVVRRPRGEIVARHMHPSSIYYLGRHNGKKVSK